MCGTCGPCGPCRLQVPRAVKVTENSDGTYFYAFDADEGKRDTSKKISEMRSSWGATDAVGALREGADYLYELGQADLSMNVDTAQNSRNLDSLFTRQVPRASERYSRRIVAEGVRFPDVREHCG